MRVSRLVIGLICSAVWLLVVLGILLHWPTDSVARLLGLASLILLSHVLFAGYFLLVRLPIIPVAITVLVTMIAILALLSPWTLTDYRLVAINFLSLFVAAIRLHQQTLASNVSAQLNQLCRYKIKLELGILGYTLLQTLLLWRYPQHQVGIVAAGLGLLLLANLVIITYHQIYRQCN